MEYIIIISSVYFVLGVFFASSKRVGDELAAEFGPQSRAELEDRIILAKLVIKICIVIFWPILIPSMLRHGRIAHYSKIEGLRASSDDSDLFSVLSRGDPKMSVGEDGQFSGAYGDFGSISNPIPLKSINGLLKYKDTISKNLGQDVVFVRRYSVNTDLFSYPCDLYDVLIDDNVVGSFVCCLYAQSNSKRIIQVQISGQSRSSSEVEDKLKGVSYISEEKDQFTECEPQDVETVGLALELIIGEGKTKRNIVKGEAMLRRIAASGDDLAKLAYAKILWRGDKLAFAPKQALYWLDQISGVPTQEHEGLRNSVKSYLHNNQSPDQTTSSSGKSQHKEQNKTNDDYFKFHNEGDIKRKISSQFEYDCDFDTADRINITAYKMGVLRGWRCREAAARKLALSVDQFAIDNLVAIEELARRLAERRGFLSVGETSGMGSIVDGGDPLFDERRAAFISGVYAGIEGHYED